MNFSGKLVFSADVQTGCVGRDCVKLFLTSEIGATVKIDGKRCPGKLDNRYGFLDLFQHALRKTERMLYVSAYVDDNLRVSEWYANTIESLKKEKIEFQESPLWHTGRSTCLIRDK